MAHPVPDKQNKLTRAVTTLDLVILLGNVCRGQADPMVGHEDVLMTPAQLIVNLTRRHRLWTSELESALWSCNLLNEKDLFWHPQGVSLDKWIKRMLPQDNFDKFYNILEMKNV